MTTTTKPAKPFTIAKGLSKMQWIDQITKQPKNVIGSNNKLKKDKIYQWSIPAFKSTIVRNGSLYTMKTCPNAGECASLCYACQGGYNFKSSMIAHARNLNEYLNYPNRLKARLIDSINNTNLNAFRIHDSGDFFNKTYALWWFSIIEALPHIQFYAYTKQVKMFKETLKTNIPKNLSLIFSYGGKEDHLIDESTDRHSKVWMTKGEMKKAGYSDTTKSDKNASNPKIKNIGLVYHGIMNVSRFNDMSMGTKTLTVVQIKRKNHV